MLAAAQDGSAATTVLAKASRETVMARMNEPKVVTRSYTEEERRRMLEVLDELRQLREEMFRERGGRLFPSSGADLDELRAEREDELQ
jgi:hypothetical protein